MLLCCRANGEALALQKLLSWMKMKKYGGFLLDFLGKKTTKQQNPNKISAPGCNNYLYLLYLFYCFFTCSIELAYHISGLTEQMCRACIYPLGILPCLNTDQINFGLELKDDV